MRFEDPIWLLCLLWLPVWFWWQQQKQVKPTLSFSKTQLIQSLSSAKSWMVYVTPCLQGLIWVLLVLAIARPQTGRSYTQTTTEGVDLLLAVDTSGSMRALDLTWNSDHVTRLAVVKRVLEAFIEKRPHDRIGMVVFGNEAFTQAPLTLDHELLNQLLEELFIGMAGDNTAIGSAIVIGTKRLKELEAKSKILILITDGENTAGVDPLQAAKAANELGLKIYTIGVGSEGPAPIEVDGIFGKRLVYQDVSIDETTLKAIATLTGGQYFRATDTQSLQQIYETIDALEKTKVETKEYHEYKDHFHLFVMVALALLSIEFILRQTRLRTFPKE